MKLLRAAVACRPCGLQALTRRHPGPGHPDPADQVRAALATLPEVWGCSHIHLLWDAARGGTVVQVLSPLPSSL